VNRTKFGPFVVERARGGGYQIRNTETGSLSYRRTKVEAIIAAEQSHIRRQDRLRQEAKS
jgi:hypothetical protein